jgi:hypothetical protein
MVTLYKNVQFWFQYDAVNPQVIENEVCEGTDHLKAALPSGVTSLNVMVAPARGLGCGQSEAVILLYVVPWPSTPTYRVKTQDSKHYDFTSDQNLHLLSK